MNDDIKNIVDNYLCKIKTKPYLWGAGVALCFLLIPIVIWLLYFIGDMWWGIPTKITADGVLGFYGAFLAFLGTVSLGALALWQNNQLKKENEKSQEKLEYLQTKANEIGLIRKIIDFESKRIANLQESFNDFSEAIAPNKVATEVLEVISRKKHQNNQDIELILILENCQNSLRKHYLAVSNLLELDIEQKKGTHSPIRTIVDNAYNASKDLIYTYVANLSNGSEDVSIGLDDAVMKKISFNQKEFNKEKECYLHRQEEKLQRVLFENLSLDEIKLLYHYTQEGNENGIHESATGDK